MQPSSRVSVASMLIVCLALLPWGRVHAGLDDCLKAAMSSTNPDDVKKAAVFAAKYPSCVAHLVPPDTVPYVALSGSLDAANQSGALSQIGLGFSNYAQCTANFDLGRTSLKQMAPVLRPICSSINLDCQTLENDAAGEINARLTEQVPMLDLLPCACAAATSGLGVEKLAKLVRDAGQCASTAAEVGKALQNVASGTFKTGQDAVELGADVAKAAYETGKAIVNTAGNAACEVGSWVGACDNSSDSPPPPTAWTTATAICKPRGGIWTLSSRTQQPDDFSVTCNSGLDCWARPGKPLECTQLRTVSELQQDLAEMQQWCPAHAKSLTSGYHAQCHDNWCKVAVNNVASQYEEQCLGALSASQAASGPSGHSRDEYRKWMQLSDQGFIGKFDTLVVESIRRDPNTTPRQFLSTYDCRTFLGRVEQFNCRSSGGFQQCKKMADAGKVHKCFLAGSTQEYAGLNVSGKAAQLIRDAADDSRMPRDTVTSPDAVIPPAMETLPATPSVRGNSRTIQIDGTPRDSLTQRGCTPVRGQGEDRQCVDDAAFAYCMRMQATRQVKVCRNAATGEVRSRD